MHLWEQVISASKGVMSSSHDGGGGGVAVVKRI